MTFHLRGIALAIGSVAAVALGVSGGSKAVLVNSTGQQVIFLISGLTNGTHYGVSYSCSGANTNCASPRGSGFDGFVGSNWPITFNAAAAPGAGTIYLTVTGGGSSAQGSYTITVAPPYGLAVTP